MCAPSRGGAPSGRKPSRGTKRLRICLAFFIRSSRWLCGSSRSRSHVCTYQCGSRRSIEYGSTVRVVTSVDSGFRYSSSTIRCPSIARVSVATRSPSTAVRLGRLGEVEGAEGLLELRAHAIERRGVPAATIGPTNSSASRMARASSGVSRGARRKVSPRRALVDVHLVAAQLGIDGTACRRRS